MPRLTTAMLRTIDTAAGAVAVRVAVVRFDASLPALDLRPLELLALAVIGVLTGLLAAALPARGAARQDVVAALSGRRGVIRSRKPFPVVGLVVAGLGAALALGGGALAPRSRNAALLLDGYGLMHQAARMSAPQLGFHGYVTVQGRGTVALPPAIRKRYHLDRKGAQVEITEREDGVLELRPAVAVPATQAWFWEERWQVGERAVDEHVRRGEITVSEGVEEFLDDLSGLDQE